jgi:hypothetical protein
MPRGGRRSGRPGAQYPNRSDLAAGPRQAAQPVRAAPNQPYGARGAQEAAQQTMPLPQVTPLDAPTERPAEPVTAGLPSGPGPGPEALGAAGPGSDDTLTRLKVLFQAHPNDDLGRLITDIETSS